MNSNLDRMRAGEPYVADDPEMARLQARARRLARDYAEAYDEDAPRAQAILEQLLGSVGTGVDIRPPFFVDYGTNISIGARTFINFNLTALDVARITIGADCQLATGVQLLTPTHPLEQGPRRAKLESAKSISIGDNVWIGGGAIVLPGVSIGDDSVVGAGAVVTKDVPAGVVVAGNPARVIRSL